MINLLVLLIMGYGKSLLVLLIMGYGESLLVLLIMGYGKSTCPAYNGGMVKTRFFFTDVKSSACPVFKATLQADRKHVILVP